MSNPWDLCSDWICQECDSAISNETVCDMFNIADTVHEDTEADASDDIDEQIMKLEAAIYKLSLLVHHNNYWNMQVHKGSFKYSLFFCLNCLKSIIQPPYLLLLDISTTTIHTTIRNTNLATNH